ncbi:MAG TPA: hypothetical protein VLV83_19145 [Acidobacteriota bacterium]|nr:hypothetical protein [Acidobacteriota bacterium]
MGLIRRFHWLQWLAASLLLGPFALLLSPFLQGRGYTVSLLQRAQPRPSRPVPSDEKILHGPPLFVPEIRQLQSEGKLDEAADMLVVLIDTVEEKARRHGTGVPHWYYEQLARIYRKQEKTKAEIKVLKRCLDFGTIKPNASKRLQKRLNQVTRRL